MTEAAISLSESATARVRDLLDEEGNPAMHLRIYITGGGCSGFSYGFKFDENVNEDDTRIDEDGVRVLVDAMSIQYLAGSEVDFERELIGARFVIKNPNATSTCGCGSSFAA